MPSKFKSRATRKKLNYPLQLDPRRLVSATDAEAEQVRLRAGVLRNGVAPLTSARPRAPTPLKETKPGKERWSIKTGMDSQAAGVGSRSEQGQFVFVDTTIEELARLPRPPDMLPPTRKFRKYASRRAIPVETTIWRLEVEIINLKLEDDGDLHLVLRGASGALAIAEAPTARAPFVGRESPWLEAMGQVRLELQERFGRKKVPLAIDAAEGRLLPPAAFAASPARAMVEQPPVMLRDLMANNVPFAVAIPPTRARIVGVGFFDRVHGQTGVAPNGIELHPVLGIEFL